MATVEDVRRLALVLPRTEEHLIRDRVKFRIGRIVYLALSRDETTLGFAFPKEERAALVASEPAKFSLPSASDLRYNWAQASLAALGPAELAELIDEAWRMCVPKSVARAHPGPDPGSRAPAVPVAPAPSLSQLQLSAEVFAGYENTDRSWLELRRLTAPAPDLTDPAHRRALHRWLNSWGCRLPYPREGEPYPLGEGLAAWTQRHLLPCTPLADLTDAETDALATAYGELARLPAGRPPRTRSLGPTAAAKALYALRPHTVMPWDAAIATELYGARDAAAFARHLRTGRAWARAVLTEGGLDADALVTMLGRPAVTLPKVLDDHLYVTITRRDAR